MGNVRVTGGKGIDFTATLNIDNIKQNSAAAKRLMSDLAVSSEGLLKKLDAQQVTQQSVVDSINKANAAINAKRIADQEALKPLTEYQKRQIELKQILIDAQSVSEELRQKNLLLDASYKEGKITALEYKNELDSLKVSEQELKNQYQANKISIQEYTEQLEKNKLEQQSLNAALTQAAIDDKKAATALKEYNLQQKELAEAAKAARLAQVAASGSYDEANQKLKDLGRAIKSAEGGFNSTNPAIKAQIADYKKLNQSLKDFDDVMGNHQRHVGGYKEALDGAGADLKAMALNYVSAYAALSAITAVVKTNAEISDSLADVRRTANLTDVEVNNLAESLKKIDTRTSLKGLLDISVIGGQLGIAKDQLAGFTKAIDQLSVTLAGEISGGAEAVASSLGKINGVFKVQEKEGTDVETSFNKTGSAILALGQAGLATGEFLQDFGLRTAGVANTAKISLPTILAYGATLEETGSSAEVAGSAIARLIGNLASKKDQFYTIARIADSTLTIKSFTNLINTDANAALGKFFAGINAGGKDLTSFTSLIDTIGLKGGPAKNAIIALAQNQELLNERIKESKTAYDAGTLSSEQFALKNDNLAASISKLGNVFTNITTSGRIANFFKSIIDGLTDATKYYAGLINSRGWEEFWDRLATGTQRGEKSNDFRYNSLPDAANAAFNTKSLLDFANSVGDPTKNPYVQKNIGPQIAQNQAALKVLRDTYNQLQVFKKDGTITDYNKETLGKVAKYIDEISTQQSALVKFLDVTKQVKKAVVTSGVDVNEIADSELKTVREINARILELKNDALANPANKQNDIQRIQSLKATLRELAGLSKAADDESFKSRANLLREVSDATEAFNRKTLTADQQALTNISDRFEQLRKKIEVFNADPKNKNNQISRTVITKLNAQQSSIIDDQANLNENIYIQQDIEKKKKLYADYEFYKIKAGSTAADAEYSELLRSGKNFADYLSNIKDSINKADISGPIQERSALTDKQIEENIQAQKKAYEELLLATETYNQRREAIIENGLRDEKTLNYNNHADQAAQVARDTEDALTSLDEEHFRMMKSYQYLFDNIDIMTEASAKKQIAILYGLAAVQLATGKLTVDAYLNIIKGLDRANLSIKNKLPDELKAIGQGLSDIGGEAGKFNEELGKALNTAGSLVSSVGSIKGNLATLAKDSGASSVSKISAGLGIIGTAVGIFTTVYSLFDHSKEKAEQLAYANELQLRAIEAVNKALERQLALTKQIQGPERIAAYNKDLADIQKRELENQAEIDKRFGLTGNKQLDAEIASRNNGGKVNSFYNNVIQQLKDLGAISSLAGKSIGELQDLLDKHLLDDQTAALVQSQIDLQQKLQDTKNALNEEITGINFDSLKDNIKEVFASGKTDAKSFADAIEDSIKGAFANAFERNVIETALQPFYDELAKDGGDGVFTADEIKQLRDMKSSISDALAAKAKAYQDILGPDPTDPTSSPSTLTGDIKNITEDTGTIIAGTMHGIQLATIQVKDLLTVQGKTIGDMYQAATSSFAELVKIEANTFRTANNTDLLIPTLLRIETKLGTGSAALGGNGRSG